ncbi:hypothetical protein Btru_047918 [Bulinus truncatus]|nr:hypothetical protein Btru_047918 [Bulinus truncatus]
MSFLLHSFVFILATFIGNVELIHGTSCVRQNEPSLNHLNFLAMIVGKYYKTEFIIGNVSMPQRNFLEILPVTTGLVDWPRAGSLYAQEFFGNKTVRRSLYVTREKDNGNTINFFPYNFTSEFTTLTDRFDTSRLNCLLPTDLDYSHKCDRVVKPSTTKRNAFDFVSWPYCSGDLESPPIYSAVVTCQNITVSFTDIRALNSTPPEQRMYFVLTKTQKVALPQCIIGGRRFYKNPCP